MLFPPEYIVLQVINLESFNVRSNLQLPRPAEMVLVAVKAYLQALFTSFSGGSLDVLLARTVAYHIPEPVSDWSTHKINNLRGEGRLHEATAKLLRWRRTVIQLHLQGFSSSADKSRGQKARVQYGCEKLRLQDAIDYCEVRIMYMIESEEVFIDAESVYLMLIRRSDTMMRQNQIVRNSSQISGTRSSN